MSESDFEFRQYFEHILLLVFRAQPFGNLASLFVRTPTRPMDRSKNLVKLPAFLENPTFPDDIPAG
jgi:hypothetical protein